jgi:hypothetical protein
VLLYEWGDLELDRLNGRRERIKPSDPLDHLMQGDVLFIRGLQELLEPIGIDSIERILTTEKRERAHLRSERWSEGLGKPPQETMKSYLIELRPGKVGFRVPASSSPDAAPDKQSNGDAERDDCNDKWNQQKQHLVSE